MSAIGRKCSIVNLDPANEKTSYPCAIDVRNLITLDEVMDGEGLGPNGGVMYALEELEQNIEWLEEGLSRLGRKSTPPRQLRKEILLEGGMLTDVGRGLRDIRLSGTGGAFHASWELEEYILKIAEDGVSSPSLSLFSLSP